MAHQKEAVDSGYWPLYRYDPRRRPSVPPRLAASRRCRSPTSPARRRASRCWRARGRSDAEAAGAEQAQQDVDERWHLYEQLAGSSRRRRRTAVSGPDLRTRYLGLELTNPLVPRPRRSAADLDMLRRLEEAGAGAVVLPSLFEEQIEHEAMERPPGARGRPRELRRGARLLPRAGRLQHRARTPTSSTSPPQGGALGSR